MLFDPENPIVKLCSEGMMIEGEKEEALALFQQAWDLSASDLEKFIAAHYLARQQETVSGKLEWDKTALQYALKVSDDAMNAAYPSLYLNIGKCYEDLDDRGNARANYQSALTFADRLPDDGYGNMIRDGIRNGLERVK